MARLPRLERPGQVHAVIQRGHGGRPVFRDTEDRLAYLDALRQTLPVQPMALHAYALRDDEVMLLLTPGAVGALGLLMQGVGRRYVGGYNRRHACSGTLWDGRFRSALIAPGEAVLDALCWIDGQSVPAEGSSARHRTGQASDPLLVDPPEFWTLGNTPFDREAAYRGKLASGLSQAQAAALRRATLGGWAYGVRSGDPPERGAEDGERPLRPRSAGRPRKQP